MTVKDIEKAITQLQPSEVFELATWLNEFEEKLWDKQIEADARSGRLDSFIDQAKADHTAGKTKPL
jgi:hypothetical protein